MQWVFARAGRAQDRSKRGTARGEENAQTEIWRARPAGCAGRRPRQLLTAWKLLSGEGLGRRQAGRRRLHFVPAGAAKTAYLQAPSSCPNYDHGVGTRFGEAGACPDMDEGAEKFQRGTTSLTRLCRAPPFRRSLSAERVGVGRYGKRLPQAPSQALRAKATLEGDLLEDSWKIHGIATPVCGLISQ